MPPESFEIPCAGVIIRLLTYPVAAMSDPLEIAKANHASDRKRLIAAMQSRGDPLTLEFERAEGRAQDTARMARTGGDYPLLSGGDTNLNSLFIERAAHICKPDGIVGLLVPSGIATETASQEFFSALIRRHTAKSVYDFFNKRANGELFFPDVYYRFKFSAFVFSPHERSFGACRFATFVRDVSELSDPNTTYTLSIADFAKVNPNTVTAPIYRAKKDRDLTNVFYDTLAILVDRSSGSEKKSWPIRYFTMLHMANDSNLFRTPQQLRKDEKAYPVGANIWKSEAGTWVPLYEGKMVQAFDHRASGIKTVAENVHRPGQGEETSVEQHQDPAFLPTPRYFVLAPSGLACQIAVKDVTSTTNSRSVISCIIPPYAAGHTLALIRMEMDDQNARARAQAALCANLNSFVLDFVARTKILSNHISWYIIEQLPIVSPDRLKKAQFGNKTAEQIICDAVLELTYTSVDMAPFARDLGYVKKDGSPMPPIVWNDKRRMNLRAKLDAIFFQLYGLTDQENVAYVYSTFPIVERDEMTDLKRYVSRDLCLAWMNARAAGHSDAEIVL